MPIQELENILKNINSPITRKTPQELGLQSKPSQSDMITQLRSMGKSEQDINQIMANVGGLPQGMTQEPKPATWTQGAMENLKPMLETGPKERLEGAVSGVVEAEKGLMGKGAGMVGEGVKGIYEAFTSPETYVSEKQGGTGEMVQTPEGKERGFVNRAQQALLEGSDVIGGLGLMALGLNPKVWAFSAGAGALKPEIQTAVQGYQQLWDSVPEEEKNMITQGIRNTQIPGQIQTIGQIVDSVKNAPEDVKHGAMDILYSTGLLTLPNTMRSYQKVIDSFKKPVRPLETPTIQNVEAQAKQAGVKKGELTPQQEQTSLKMKNVDPKRAKELIKRSKEAAIDVTKKPAIDMTADRLQNDVMRKISRYKSELGKQRSQILGDEINKVIKGKDAAKKFIYGDPSNPNKLSLNKMGVQATPTKGGFKLDFSKSTIQDSIADQKMVNNILKKLLKGGTLEDIDRAKQSLGSVIFKTSSMGEPMYSGQTQTMFTTGYGYMNDSINQVLPQVADINKKMSQAIRLIQKFDSLSSKGQRTPEMLTQLFGMADTPKRNFIDELAKFAKANGIKGGDTILDEAAFATMSDKAAGYIPPRSFTGGIKQAIEAVKSPIKTSAELVENVVNSKTLPIESVEKIINYAKTPEATPALIKFADFLEKDITPQLQSLYQGAKGAVQSVASDTKGEAMMPTSFSKAGTAKVPKDMYGDDLVDLKGNPVPTNSDGTITLYHRTTPESASKIKKTGKFFSKENADETFFSNKLNGQGAGYGDDVIAVKVKPSALRVDDMFPDGEIHVAVPNSKLSLKNIADQTAAPKSLDPLIAEAKKYKSAEEFKNAILNDRGGVGSGVDYSPAKRLVQTDLNDTPLTKFGFKPNDKVTIYRGVDNASQKSIVPGDYVATSKDLAASYTNGKVISLEVPASSVRFASSDGITANDFKNGFNNTHLEAVYNPEPLIKSSQLTDLWKKAQSSF